MYLFAGRKRHSDVAAFLRQAEAKGHIRLLIKEFDIERSPNHDLTDVSLWDEVLDTLQQGGWCVIVSPPCNTFSRARFQHRQHPGPKPLRTKAWPKGFPWLSNVHKQTVSEAFFSLKSVWKLVAVLHRQMDFSSWNILKTWVQLRANNRGPFGNGEKFSILSPNFLQTVLPFTNANLEH